ncbi:OsmC family protein [Calothrix sp. NIES-4071]|nr:OsmC family protein [Calothrix sp. NIES-4071]BAZ57974.1 OsmC family protein [Calothrix sp. NIES-4105]
MSEHIAIIEWKRNQAMFTDNKYNREHTWKFDGVEIAASASPHIVPVPYSNPACVDPEEAFVASLSSCHMLFFLSIAAKRKFVVESYVDKAVGVIEKNANGQLAITKVYLRPQVNFILEEIPTKEQLEKMHYEAHHSCFLANSVQTEIIIEIIYQI